MDSNKTYQIIGACMEVHKELGCGFLEPVYQEALELELNQRNIPFTNEVTLPVHYKGQLLKKHYIADFICYDDIIVELKAVSKLTTQHEAQVLNYLKATHCEIGILINFGQTSLEYKRLIFSKKNPRKSA